ncbi:MAG: winged helix-turn-helix domain-containing protein [Nitrososphaerota archaeon]
MESKEAIDLVQVYNLLKNPLRREILTLLYTRGEMNATQLKLLLNVSYGTLYYHLEFLKPLVSQVSRGRYVLNEKGLIVVEKMMRDMGAETRTSPSTSILRMMSMASLMERISNKPSRYLALGITLMVIAVMLLYVMPLRMVILHISLNPSSGSLTTSIISLSIVLGYVLLSGEILSPYKGGFSGLLVGVFFSFIPIDAYLAFILLLQQLNIQITMITPLLQLLFIVAHVIQLVMIASALTHSRGVGWEKSLPASLILSYLSILTLYYNLL